MNADGGGNIVRRAALGWMAPILIGLAVSSGCSDHSGSTVTFYRNSPFGPGLRVHWATFDATDSSPSYNLNNCLMAARLLNANMTASAQAEGKRRDSSIGFWCEQGGYRDGGTIPTNFPEAFPTDV